MREGGGKGMRWRGWSETEVSEGGRRGERVMELREWLARPVQLFTHIVCKAYSMVVKDSINRLTPPS